MNKIYLFTEMQVIFLIKLIIAHLLADFLFQTKKMVENKKWLSKEMFLHVFIVFITTFLFSFNLYISLIITILHYLIDGGKLELNKTKLSKPIVFLLDQTAHVLIIILVWCIYFDNVNYVVKTLLIPFQNYKISLILLGFLLVTTPFGFFIGMVTKRLQNTNNKKIKTDKNGFLIGVFERLIILTFVLLAEYGAIGFLITGKSIIRFSAKNEDINSEYVLLGTMISYGMTIITGLLIKQLIN
jgi:hypothetical protein